MKKININDITPVFDCENPTEYGVAMFVKQLIYNQIKNSSDATIYNFSKYDNFKISLKQFKSRWSYNETNSI